MNGSATLPTVGGIRGRAWLDWWANSATRLGSAEVDVVVTSTSAGWRGHGSLVNEDEAAGFALLCDLDPLWSLRFGDGSTTDVVVHLAVDQREFTLAEPGAPVA